MSGLIEYEIATLNKRGIDEDTCKLWDYGVGTYNGKPVQVANYKDRQGTIKAQKLRFQDKKFIWLGDPTKISLFGMNLWRDEGKFATIVEGEIDALSLSQILNNKWAVFSVPNGAGSAAKAVAESLKLLEGYESVVLCLDQDEQGRAAALEAANMLPPGKAKIVTSLPCKDANECLVQGKTKDLVDAIYGAKIFRPDGVIPGEECWDLIANTDTTPSIPYPWAGLNEKCHGIRCGEMTTLTAGTGIGKSSVARELAYYLIGMNQNVGYVALEESIKKTSECIMGLYMNCPPHYWSRENVTKEQKREAFDHTIGSGRMVLYDHFGSIDPSNLLLQIRYMARAMNCKYIFLDHLSIVVSALESGDERRMIDNTMTRLRSLVEETGIHLVLVSHLRRPDGRSHEEGGQTSLAQLRGSHAIAQLSDMVIGCERNQQDEAMGNLLQLRVLKNRYTGECGLTSTLEYVRDSGRLVEWEAPDVVEVPV